MWWLQTTNSTYLEFGAYVYCHYFKQNFNSVLSNWTLLWSLLSICVFEGLWRSKCSAYIIFSLAFSKLSATKYRGWYSVIGYFWTAVLKGSNGFSSGLPLKLYCSSPNEDSRPAPYALSFPSCLHRPNSTINQ